jgi:hypothetical protein
MTFRGLHRAISQKTEPHIMFTCSLSPLHLLVVMFNQRRLQMLTVPGTNPDQKVLEKESSLKFFWKVRTSTYVFHSSYILNSSPRPLLVSSFRPHYVLVHNLIAYLFVGYCVNFIQILGFVLS